MTLERTGVASKSSSMDLNDFHTDFLTADWYAEWDMLQHFSLGLAVPDDSSPFRKVSELPLPPPSSTGEFHPTFSSETPLDNASFFPVVRRNDLPSFPDVPGPSDFRPQTIVISLDDGAGQNDACYKGVTGVGLRVTGGTHSPIVLPTLPPQTPLLPLVTTFPLNWTKVPQRNYDHGRKQWSFKQLEPVSFSVGGRPGINMGHALRKIFEGLDDRDDPVLQDTTGTISCRFLFPGYPANNSSCQIHVLDWTRKRSPITRGKLAYEIAKKLERYLRYMAKFALDGSVENRWTIGQGLMRIDNMFLVRLVSVSKGSFQPEIWVEDPSMPHTV